MRSVAPKGPEELTVNEFAATAVTDRILPVGEAFTSIDDTMIKSLNVAKASIAPTVACVCVKAPSAGSAVPRSTPANGLVDHVAVPSRLERRIWSLTVVDGRLSATGIS